MTTEALMLTAAHRILIVDDHPLVADGLMLAIRHHMPGTQVSHAQAIEDALSWLSQHDRPDLVLLDLGLPGITGINAIRALLNHDPALHIVILSARDDRHDIHRALEAGARNFISKSTDSHLVLSQIRAALTACPDSQRSPQARASRPHLTPRQKDVLQLLARGYPNKRICQCLSLTEDTVKTHLKAIYQALRVHNRTECVAVATRLQLINPLESADIQP